MLLIGIYQSSCNCKNFKYYQQSLCKSSHFLHTQFNYYLPFTFSNKKYEQIITLIVDCKLNHEH